MKLIGCIFITIASIYASHIYEKSLKKAIKNTSDLYSLIVHIKSQIEYFAMPISEIFSDYATENEAIIDILKRKENADLSFLSNHAKDTTYSLLSELGKGFKKEQIALCEFSASILNDYKEQLGSELAKKTKICRSLCLFIGACTIILLV